MKYLFVVIFYYKSKATKKAKQKKKKYLFVVIFYYKSKATILKAVETQHSAMHYS